jgi:hypothetical protein
MKSISMSRVVARLLISLGAAAAVALPAGVAAATPPTPLFTECPAVGLQTGCGVLITVLRNGATTVVTDPSQPGLNGGLDTMVAVVNKTTAVVPQISLGGVPLGHKPVTQPFGFDWDGPCTVTPSYCTHTGEFGPTGYEGPDTSFTYGDNGTEGSVIFTGGLLPGHSRFFALDQSPFAVTGIQFQPSITVTGQAVSTTAGSTTPVEVATFKAKGGSTSVPADFSATVNWGDGSPPGTGTVSQAGPGMPYVVMAAYPYPDVGTYPTTITIFDPKLATNTATGDGSADVTAGDIVCSPVGCGGTVTSQTQAVGVTSTSTTGSINVALQPPDGSLDCGDPFRHAPQYTVITDAGLGANIDFTITFNNADAAGLWYVPFAVCYQATTPFTDYYGNTGVTLGLLPDCGDPLVAPCVQSIVQAPDPLGNPDLLGTVTENVVVPPGDPRMK